MRSNDEIDKSIDVLISRVYILEKEVARLKGEPQAKETNSAQPCNTIEIPDAAFIRKTKPKRDANKAIDSSLENAIGTRWIGRIGVLAIIFGVAFFLKYSFDNKLIGETGRVVLGILWGAIFLGAGEYLQKKKNLGLYGQMLSGCALAVLYLSLYAAFALYHLIPAPLAAAGMLAVTATGMTLCLFSGRHSSSGRLSYSDSALHWTKSAVHAFWIYTPAGHRNAITGSFPNVAFAGCCISVRHGSSLFRLALGILQRRTTVACLQYSFSVLYII